MIPVSSRFANVILGAGLLALGIAIGYLLPREPVVSEKEIPSLYTVVAVIDGDTITVEMGNKIETVRLLGIDTPEVSNPYTPEECFGEEASKRTEELLEGKKVNLVSDPLSSDRDMYGRLLRYVFRENGSFVNAELIRDGYAYNYIYEPFQFMKEFNRLETDAKSNKVGLWLQCDVR